MIKFRDINFKIAVVALLHNAGHFTDELEELSEEYSDMDDFSYKPIKEVVNYIKKLNITQDLLDKIDSMSVDVTSDVYEMCMNNWDGESHEFDIKNLEDVALLKNLERFYYSPEIVTNISLEPLLKLEKFKEFHTLNKDLSKEQEKIITQLKNKGVKIVSI